MIRSSRKIKHMMPDLLKRTITGFSNFVKRRGTGARGNSKLIHCVFPVETKVFAIAFAHRNAEIGVLQIQFDHEVLGYQNVHKRRNSFHFEVCIPDWLIDWVSLGLWLGEHPHFSWLLGKYDSQTDPEKDPRFVLPSFLAFLTLPFYLLFLSLWKGEIEFLLLWRFLKEVYFQAFHKVQNERIVVTISQFDK